MRLTFATVLLATAAAANNVVNETTCGGTNYQYTGLEGFGFISSNLTDKYGDTIGGTGSSIAIDQASWHKTSQGAYSGILFSAPDRGWNTNGTINYQNRIQKFQITLKLAPNASAENPSKPNLRLKYLDTILLKGPDGEPVTSLDADVTGNLSYPGFPPLPVATYTGDGFGGSGPGGKRLSLDSEGLALASDGGFWISDEYGPYIYKFDSKGLMIHAIQPPEAFLPRRNGSLSFNSNTPPIYDPSAVPNPINTETGRDNNQGFEGVTISADGKTLYTLIQSALDQEGGPNIQHTRNARMLAYDISAKTPEYIHEWVVQLPKYRDTTEKDANKEWKIAAQSEIHQLPTGDFLVLARDSGFGRGQDKTQSIYRHADVFSVLNTPSVSDIKGQKDYDTPSGAIASSDGVLNSDITPAEYCSFVDYNVNSELAKFGLHNGGLPDTSLLNEKWESLSLVPVNPGSRGDNEYFLFSMSDNDFMTQDGHMNGGKLHYKDTSGYSLDSQVLVFKIQF